MQPCQLREYLDKVYSRYNRREYIHPDPLEFIFRYSTIEDREIIGLLASGLAYGRVSQILRSTEKVLSILGSSPSDFLRRVSIRELSRDLDGFKHRFTTGLEIAVMLKSASALQVEWGLLGNMLEDFLSENVYTHALEKFTVNILKGANLEKCSLLPRPLKGSACKRLHLFMRWMIRSDEVDPGCWDRIPSSTLIVPLDVHMFRAARMLGLTARRTTSLAAALEITDRFREINAEDPVKYDFSLTRMGILELHQDTLFRELFKRGAGFIDRKQ